MNRQTHEAKRETVSDRYRILRRFTTGCLAIFAIRAVAAAETVTLLPAQDTPIYADDGVTTFEFAKHSNGAGETLYVGTNGTGSARRSLVQFDLSVLPTGSRVTKAKLTLFCDREPEDAYETLSLHTVLEPWTTGGSNSDVLGTPGQGAPAEPGDSTWYYRSWPGPDQPEGVRWSEPGAVFDPAIIASQQVGPLSIGGDQNSVYVWSSDAMVDSINAWIANPTENFGWIMTGNETQTRSVKRFISVEGRVNNWLKPNLILSVEIPAGAPATLSLQSSANPADFAQSFIITASLLGGNAPGGTVGFRQDDSALSGCTDVPVSNGTAVCRIPKLPAGSYQITANYSGDGSNAPILSKPMTQVVDEPKTIDDSTTWIVLTSSNTASTPAEMVSFTASVRGGLGPAGTVTFVDGTQILCDGVTLARRTAVCKKATLSKGKHRIVAIYSGDDHNLASSSPPLLQSVQKRNACTAASPPLLEPLNKVWSIHAGESLSLAVAASDCLHRPLQIKTSKLPRGASFVQSFDEASSKQKGIFTWTPGNDSARSRKSVSFRAVAKKPKGSKASARQQIRIRVLPPETGG